MTEQGTDKHRLFVTLGEFHSIERTRHALSQPVNPDFPSFFQRNHLIKVHVNGMRYAYYYLQFMNNIMIF